MDFENVEINEFSSLCNICQTLYSTKDLEKALDKIVDSAMSALKVKGCSVKILNERRNKLDIYSMKGMSRVFIENLGIYSMFNSPINQEALNGKYVYIEDVEKVRDIGIPEELIKEGIKFIASLPLKVEQQIIGVLSVYHDEPRSFNDKEKAFLHTLAIQGGAVIKSLRNFERIETLLNVAKTINSTLELDDVFQQIVNQAARALKCRASSIRLLDESTNKLIFKTAYGLSKKYIEEIPRGLEQSFVEKYALESRKVIYVEDMTTDPDVTMQKEADEEGLASMLCAPLVFQDKAIGILKIYTATPTIFTKEEIRYMQSLAELAAIAVRNASFYEKIHSLYQVTSSLATTLETNTLLDLLAMHATDYLKAMGSRVLVWDKERDKFSTCVAYRLEKEFLDSASFSKDTWSVKETLKGNTIIIGNLEEDERPEIKKAALKAGIRSMISIPLKTMDRVNGVLQVYCKTPRNFTSDEIEFLTTLVNHGAIALENAKLHEYFKNEYERLIDDIYVWHDWTSYVIRE